MTLANVSTKLSVTSSFSTEMLSCVIFYMQHKASIDEECQFEIMASLMVRGVIAQASHQSLLSGVQMGGEKMSYKTIMKKIQ